MGPISNKRFLYKSPKMGMHSKKNGYPFLSKWLSKVGKSFEDQNAHQNCPNNGSYPPFHLQVICDITWSPSCADSLSHLYCMHILCEIRFTCKILFTLQYITNNMKSFTEIIEMFTILWKTSFHLQIWHDIMYLHACRCFGCDIFLGRVFPLKLKAFGAFQPHLT